MTIDRRESAILLHLPEEEDGCQDKRVDTISFHVGLMERVWARQGPPVEEGQRRRLAQSWRRWTQAPEALDAAEEAEEFQAVGMRCRECLLAFIKVARAPGMPPSGKEESKTGDFLGWSQRLAEGLAPGAKSKAVRGYLKAIAAEAWQLVNWLTHAGNATRTDGQIALDATQAVLAAFGAARPATCRARWPGPLPGMRVLPANGELPA